jgi:hypothetical protein
VRSPASGDPVSLDSGENACQTSDLGVDLVFVNLRSVEMAATVVHTAEGSSQPHNLVILKIGRSGDRKAGRMMRLEHTAIWDDLG